MFEMDIAMNINKMKYLENAILLEYFVLQDWKKKSLLCNNKGGNGWWG